MSKLLQVSDVSFRYPSRTVISHVNFAAHEGEFIALMGCNGAGKSTLLDLITGLRTPAGGQIVIKGKTLRDWPRRELARQISHLPQTIRADLPFTAEQLVLMGRYSQNSAWLDSEADCKAAQLAMQRTSSWEDRARRFFTLSGGERQRVLLAACLAQEADICLFDEPSVFLDIDQQLRCFDLLAEEAGKGRLCIAVTHDLNLAMRYCSRLIVLSGQKLAADVSTTQAREDSAWLQIFSPRLQLGVSPDGMPWIWYR
jgi:iron complex transport system ATP-binding protein